MLSAYGYKHLVMVDSRGIISKSRKDLNSMKQGLLTFTNPENLTGSLETAMQGAGVFIGVSKGGLLTSSLIKRMNAKPIIIAMANPVPEVMPNLAMKAGAVLVATGRSDFPNQVNNALAFPGIFRGAIDARAKISEKMKLAAAEAIVKYHQDSLRADHLLPDILDAKIHAFIAREVKNVA
jgi:malate dehydrogenase (oxaloacetate-decarboxylating)